MDEVIIYILPGGKHIVQDLSRIATIPSDGGQITISDESGKLGVFRVAKSNISYTVASNEITKSVTTIELEV